jgi:hypothetical protein
VVADAEGGRRETAEAKKRRRDRSSWTAERSERSNGPVVCLRVEK